MKLYQVLKVFKPYQMVNIHWQHDNTKLEALKPCKNYWNDYCQAKRMNKNLGVFGMDIENVIALENNIEIFLKTK